MLSKTGVSLKDLEDLGWKNNNHSQDWYFHSSTSKTTFIHLNCQHGNGSLTVHFITLMVNGQMVGKLYNDATGHTNWSLLDGKNVGTLASIEFRRALKPLM